MVRRLSAWVARLEARANQDREPRSIVVWLGADDLPEDFLDNLTGPAIDILLLEHIDQAVAEQIGVARETICRWRNENPYFMAELNRRRKDVWQTSRNGYADSWGRPSTS
jgi:hypothetical protein